MNRKCLSILALMVDENPFVSEAIEKFPNLEEQILEYPNIVHSLLNTGRVNRLCGDAQAFIKPGIVFGPDNYQTFHYEIDGIHQFTDYTWNVHGVGDRPSCLLGFSVHKEFVFGDGQNEQVLVYAEKYLNRNLHFELDFPSHLYSVTDEDGTVILSKSFTPVKPSRSGAMSLYRWSPNGVSFNAALSRALFEFNNERHELVPFMKASGECGMIDVSSGEFYGNANTTGSFYIETT